MEIRTDGSNEAKTATAAKPSKPQRVKSSAEPIEDFSDEKFEAVVEKAKGPLEAMAARARDSAKNTRTTTL